MAANLYIVIIGCGRVGSFLASRLSHLGHAVIVIDKDESTFAGLSPQFSGFRQEGDATQLAVLNHAKLDKADVLIATTHKDNVNLMVAQIAKKVFNVKKVLARVFDPKREAVYRHLGIETICPTSLAAEMFLHAVDASQANKGVTRQ